MAKRKQPKKQPHRNPKLRKQSEFWKAAQSDKTAERVVVPDVVHCPDCHEFKPLEKFRKSSGSLHGRWRGRCLRCHELKKGSNGSVIGIIRKRGWYEEMWKSQGGLCGGCWLPLGDDVSGDHIVPVNKGGALDRDNLQLMHKRCNTSKYDKDVEAYQTDNGRLALHG